PPPLLARLARHLLLGGGRLPKRLAAAPALAPRLVEHLNEEPARRAEVERPAPVEFMGRLHVEAVGLQPLVERVHLLPAVLPEADVKGPRARSGTRPSLRRARPRRRLPP